MDKIKVKKEKVIKEFRDELIAKNVDPLQREIYDEPFFKILNHIYQYHPKEIKCHISRLNSLTFLMILDHTYIYIDWAINRKFSTLLSITIMDGEFDDSGIYTLSLDDALKNIDKVCKKETSSKD